jgi:hypothetical protein
MRHAGRGLIFVFFLLLVLMGLAAIAEGES